VDGERVSSRPCGHALTSGSRRRRRHPTDTAPTLLWQPPTLHCCCGAKMSIGKLFVVALSPVRSPLPPKSGSANSQPSQALFLQCLYCIPPEGSMRNYLLRRRQPLGPYMSTNLGRGPDGSTRPVPLPQSPHTRSPVPCETNPPTYKARTVACRHKPRRSPGRPPEPPSPGAQSPTCEGPLPHCKGKL
jgi:hypothetical protein